MKKLTLVFLSVITLTVPSYAQNPTYAQKLYYTCKVWGFVKYFHSNVSVCGVNWDSVLLHCLPLVKSAVTKNDFNNALDTMLNAAGPMAIAVSPPCDTMAPELKRNLNFTWINDTMLRNDVQVILDTIKNNFRPHAECWVENNPYVNSYNGWLLFPYDSLMLNQNTYLSFPDEGHKLMTVFKHWNIINYFNPYNYIHNRSWDSTLYYTIPGIDSATNDYSFYIALRKMTAENNDAHTEGLTYDAYQWFPYGYSLPLILKHIPNKYIVVKSAVPAIHIGDEILSVFGLTTKQWEDSLSSYVSSGDSDVFRRFIKQYMLCTPVYNQSENVIYKDSIGNTHTLSVRADSVYYANWFYSYYPNDTLANTHYTYWSNCNVGYVNMGLLQPAEVNSMYSDLAGASAIIFDIRNYPNGTAWPIANIMYPNQITFANLTVPDVTYPGTYYWSPDYLGTNGNPYAYSGQVILLFNEETQSQAEFTCMILGAMPNVVKIGSQTAATDGNVTFYRLSQYVQTGFTTLGVFYPNGDSTERVGIIPDSIVYPTQTGIRAGRDEVLEKALQVVGCPLAVQNEAKPKPGVLVYPNPSNGIYNILLSGVSDKAIVELYNVLGEKIYSEALNSAYSQIDISNNAVGIYLYRVITETGSLISEGKIIKE